MIQQICPVFLNTIDSYRSEKQAINANSIVRIIQNPNNVCRVEYTDGSGKLCFTTVRNEELEKKGLDILA